ncbi:PucR family transcriptional regulator [Amycolatopsis jejuensis]|uniref:PucR family transcriptional regulator n=1 Tax=Amycolatopsis jejuensis TaxID=330084 RepID=UPI000A016A61|nr:helix-turn-helix domain-containing protein [Amycolatopsis jejuensis]
MPAPVRAMATALERLADYLAVRLQRSVAIDDAHFRLLAYTSHAGEVDTVRTQSIMRRSVSGELIDYLNSQGAAKANDVFTVLACPSLGLGVARIGMPIRLEGTLLGYLWLLDSEGAVSGTDAAALRGAAGDAALILHREYLAGEVTRGRERELVRDLVSLDPTLRAEAADTLIEEELIVAGPVTALVVTINHDRGEPLDEQSRVALDIAVDHGRRNLPPKHALTLNRPDHSLLLAVPPGRRATSVEQTAEELAGAMHSGLVTGGVPATGACWVGIGATRQRIAEVHGSYREARHAADVARITGALGSTVPYLRLGVYAVLAKLPPDELADGIHPGIRLLLDSSLGHAELIETLKAYFDNAGDVQRAASQLHIHRATLYYRLRRTEELTGLNLSRGDDRLAAHLSLKLAQLIRE